MKRRAEFSKDSCQVAVDEHNVLIYKVISRALLLKTGDGQPSVSSNLTASASASPFLLSPMRLTSVASRFSCWLLPQVARFP
jgi:hypothetical protein